MVKRQKNNARGFINSDAVSHPALLMSLELGWLQRSNDAQMGVEQENRPLQQRQKWSQWHSYFKPLKMAISGGGNREGIRYNNKWKKRKKKKRPTLTSDPALAFFFLSLFQLFFRYFDLVTLLEYFVPFPQDILQIKKKKSLLIARFSFWLIFWFISWSFCLFKKSHIHR